MVTDNKPMEILSFFWNIAQIPTESFSVVLRFLAYKPLHFFKWSLKSLHIFIYKKSRAILNLPFFHNCHILFTHYCWLVVGLLVRNGGFFSLRKCLKSHKKLYNTLQIFKLHHFLIFLERA